MNARLDFQQYQQPCAVVVGVDSLQGLQAARILARLAASPFLHWRGTQIIVAAIPTFVKRSLLQIRKAMN